MNAGAGISRQRGRQGKRSSALPSGECNKWAAVRRACSRVKCSKESRNGNYNQIRV